ncbi:MAG: hypothetical protein ACKOCK_13785 [Chloroflexota bacterium]
MQKNVRFYIDKGEESATVRAGPVERLAAPPEQAKAISASAPSGPAESKSTSSLARIRAAVRRGAAPWRHPHLP